MKAFLFLLFSFTLVGCTSTVETPKRIAGLVHFMSLPTPEILSNPRALNIDESLVAMRQSGTVTPLLGAFDSDEEIMALLGHIRDAAPSLRHSKLRLFRYATPSDISDAAETPVLFVWPTWKVSYQRLPPRLDLVRLELGIIAKVIPLGQVVEGRGHIALRTAFWEERCHLFALDGAYLSVSEWLADNGARWRNALAEVRNTCGQQIGNTFERSVRMLRDRI